MLTKQAKQQITNAMKAERDRLGSNAKLAKKLSISDAQISRVINGETENVLSDAKWLTIGRKLSVVLGTQLEIKIAETPTFRFVNRQLEICQTSSISLILCDAAGIGKTFAAKHYVKTTRNAIYIDCSQVKSKRRLVRKIASEFGISQEGRYDELYENLIYYLRSIPSPLIVLDEAGDLEYAAFLELKALWNATEYTCGFYMMGADGLRAKIDRALRSNKVGYTEIMRRYGEKYQKVTPDGGEDIKDFHKQQISLVAMANGIKSPQKLYAKTGGSLSRLYIELQKLNNAQA